MLILQKLTSVQKTDVLFPNKKFLETLEAYFWVSNGKDKITFTNFSLDIKFSKANNWLEF